MPCTRHCSCIWLVSFNENLYAEGKGAFQHSINIFHGEYLPLLMAACISDSAAMADYVCTDCVNGDQWLTVIVCYLLSSSLSKSPESSPSFSKGTTGRTVVAMDDDGLFPAMTSSRCHRRPITDWPTLLAPPPPHGVCVSTLRTRSSWSAIGARWPSGVATYSKHPTFPHYCTHQY